MQSIQSYLTRIQSSLASGHATEHTYRPELRDLFSELTEFHIINEPKGSEHGKPDFIFLKGEGKDAFPIAYGEAKDMHIGLEKIEKSEQLSRYFGYAKLILTNGIEFRFYRNGIRYGEPIVLATKKDSTLAFCDENFGIFRDRLLDFLASPVDTIRRANHLAEIMGGKARRIRDNLREMMGNTDRYPDIWKLYHTFKSEILHDLSHEDFADLYAQTLVYGLFVARYHDKTPDTFSRSEARDLVPKSNPLLRTFFDHIAGNGYEKRLEYIVDELCEVFAHANVEGLMHGLYQKETHDPVIHFYEDFLGEYDDSLRKLRGVFYTPAPVVKFIIRAVDDVLKTHFHLPKGLADTSKIKVERELQKYDKKGGRKTEIIETHRVQILDPATGTGTFLDEIVRHIHSKMSGQAGMWPSYVNQDLLPRLHGFELMMASYTIAHLKLGLTLAETGVPDLEKRLQIYLTNSLEEAKVKKEDQGTLFGLLESITDEAKQADEVKRDKPVMIVVGNPPYSVSSTNKGKLIQDLLIDYKKGLGEKKINLDDDYIKFIRFGESLIEKNGEGILAYISNNSFIDGITHRQMRKHLMETFDEIYILNLHGSAKKKETTPDGGKDENVFDIMQGVSINIFIKKDKNSSSKSLATVSHLDLYGKRNEKYNWLENNTLESFQNLKPGEPYYFFVPKNTDGQGKYNSGFLIKDLFPINVMGIVTAIDKIAIHYTSKEAEEMARKILNSSDPYNEFDINDQRKSKKEDRLIELQKTFEKSNPLRISYRPFDDRYMYYTRKTECWINSPRYDVMKHMLCGENIGLMTVRNNRDDADTYFIANSIADKGMCSSLDNSYFFPLYLYSDSEKITPSLCATPHGGEFPKDETSQGGEFSKHETSQGGESLNRVPNLDPDIMQKFAERIGMVYSPDRSCTNIGSSHSPLEGCPKGGVNVPDDGLNILTPEQILDYIYAVLHSPSYREKYKEFLKIDFPRVPYPDALVRSTPNPSRGEYNEFLSSKEECRKIFDALVTLGGELRALHLLESPKVEEYITTFPIAGTNEVEKIIARNSPLGELSQDDVSNSPLGKISDFENSPLGGVSRSDGVIVPEFQKHGVNVSEKGSDEVIVSADTPSWAKNSLFPYWSLPKNKNLKERSRELRKQGILSEVLFWQAFKDKEKLGWDIDRQIVIGNYIVDFWIPELGLVFEIDGSSHEGREEYDAERDAFLIGHGLQIIHILDGDVKNNLEGVSEVVYESIRKRKSELETFTPPPIVGTPQRGEGHQGTVDVYINSEQYFGDVPLVTWEFYIGGYQPAQKWLKDRKGRTLTWEDISHYQSMIVALTETSRVMGEVDKVLEV